MDGQMRDENNHPGKFLNWEIKREAFHLKAIKWFA